MAALCSWIDGDTIEGNLPRSKIFTKILCVAEYSLRTLARTHLEWLVKVTERIVQKERRSCIIRGRRDGRFRVSLNDSLHLRVKHVEVVFAWRFNERDTACQSVLTMHQLVAEPKYW